LLLFKPDARRFFAKRAQRHDCAFQAGRVFDKALPSYVFRARK